MSNLITNLSDAVFEAFASGIRGEIIVPKDSNYDEARKVYNAMINMYPGMIVKCMDVATRARSASKPVTGITMNG
jgi:hypothetical protein